MTQQDSRRVNGFSKFDKAERRRWLLEGVLSGRRRAEEFAYFDAGSPDLQQVLDNFSENTVANYPLPFGIVPNMLVDGTVYTVPMVIEESSVVAAASSAAKYWSTRGGFRTEVIATEKLGQLHFRWSGRPERRAALLPALEQQLKKATASLTARMEARGGGVRGLSWKHLPEVHPQCYQLLVRFGTGDSMGANFINTVLEAYSTALEQWALISETLGEEERELEVIMAILSNHTPHCVVRAEVSSPIGQMNIPGAQVDAADFVRRFQLAVNIAREDPYRAVTHNKGIMNGIDGVVLATGNDFRAVEAAAHAFAAESGQYRSLSRCRIVGELFHFELTLPLALGTVGGLTRLHPLANLALDLLDRPGAEQLMRIVAATGLAQNFAALRSLVTTGIQRGHMKMHLQNILSSLQASTEERQQATDFFAGRTVSHYGVRQYLEKVRGEGTGD